NIQLSVLVRLVDSGKPVCANGWRAGARALRLAIFFLGLAAPAARLAFGASFAVCAGAASVGEGRLATGSAGLPGGAGSGSVTAACGSLVGGVPSAAAASTAAVLIAELGSSAERAVVSIGSLGRAGRLSSSSRSAAAIGTTSSTVAVLATGMAAT